MDQDRNHIYVTDGVNAFDYHDVTTEQRLLAFSFERGRRFFPGRDATLVDLPTDVSRFRTALATNRWALAE
jgi:hypothetical protein